MKNQYCSDLKKRNKLLAELSEHTHSPLIPILLCKKLINILTIKKITGYVILFLTLGLAGFFQTFNNYFFDSHIHQAISDIEKIDKQADSELKEQLLTKIRVIIDKNIQTCFFMDKDFPKKINRAEKAFITMCRELYQINPVDTSSDKNNVDLTGSYKHIRLPFSRNR